MDVPGELRPDYPIETERLTLRPFAAEDLEALYAIHSLPDVARYVPWEARDRADTRRALDLKIAGAALDRAGSTLDLAAVLREDGRLVGDLTLIWRSLEHRAGEIGFVFHPDCQGHGLALEASRVLLQLGFEGLRLHRIVGRCDARNTASARLLERLGLRLEAHLVENEWSKGEWTDELVYAILQREWETR